GSNKIGRITPTGTVADFLIPTTNSQPEGVALGPDGNVWFAESNAGKLGRITPDGTITEYALPTGGNSYDVTAGPDGPIRFTDFGTTRSGKRAGNAAPQVGGHNTGPGGPTAPAGAQGSGGAQAQYFSYGGARFLLYAGDLQLLNPLDYRRSLP